MPIDPFDLPYENSTHVDAEDFTFKLDVDPDGEDDVLVPDDDLVESGVYEWLPDVLGGS